MGELVFGEHASFLDWVKIAHVILKVCHFDFCGGKRLSDALEIGRVFCMFFLGE